MFKQFLPEHIELTNVEITLIILVILVFVLLGIALLLALMTIYLRFRNMAMSKRWRKLEEKWNSIIIQIISEKVPIERLTATIHKSEKLYFIQFLMRFAERFTGKEFKIIEQLARPFLPLIVERSQGGNPERRARAIQTLSVLGFDEFSYSIVKSLDDESPMVAMVAARSLARKDYSDYIKFILPRMDRFENWSLNYFSSLLTSFGPGALKEIRNTYGDPAQSSRIRVACMSAMRNLSDLEGVPVAQRVLGETDDIELLATTLRFIKKMGSQKQHDAVRPLIEHKDFIVRANALSALGRIGSTADEVCLKKGLEDDSNWVAVHAAKALLLLGMKRALELIADSNHPRANLANQVLTENV
ncbi:MAG: HEAT repeat domain-containing protein [Candidatus Marinimicrobia bacterium]|nr:HEAT repeat domain-containing protein [Candidatus Neomarinimicrobiota bacterium]